MSNICKSRASHYATQFHESFLPRFLSFFFLPGNFPFNNFHRKCFSLLVHINIYFYPHIIHLMRRRWMLYFLNEVTNNSFPYHHAVYAILRSISLKRHSIEIARSLIDTIRRKLKYTFAII